MHGSFAVVYIYDIASQKTTDISLTVLVICIDGSIWVTRTSMKEEFSPLKRLLNVSSVSIIFFPNYSFGVHSRVYKRTK